MWLFAFKSWQVRPFILQDTKYEKLTLAHSLTLNLQSCHFIHVKSLSSFPLNSSTNITVSNVLVIKKSLGVLFTLIAAQTEQTDCRGAFCLIPSVHFINLLLLKERGEKKKASGGLQTNLSTSKVLTVDLVTLPQSKFTFHSFLTRNSIYTINVIQCGDCR